MALHNTLNFLPRVFRTVTNQRFLGATMDQLTADSANIPLNGYVGRTFAPTYKTGNNYVPEVGNLRKNYQLEPSVVITDESNEVIFNTGYIDLLRNIENYGGLVNNQQRLFGSETYNYNGRFDFDKFVNYYNYYWLPNGPASVNVYSNQAPYNADFTVSRSTEVGGYTFTGVGYQPNTQLTLVRGGTYTFQINQPGSKFWIQRSPGTSGVDANVGTLSTRDVYGVTNNGTDNGTVTFKVPLFNAQDFYILLPIKDSVDAAVTLQYTDIQNRLLSDFLLEFPDGLDGINNQLQNKSLLFIGNTQDAIQWTTPAVDAQYTALDRATIRPGDVIAKAIRTGTWKINLVAIDDLATDYIIQLSPQVAVHAREKVFINSGKTYASNQFWLNDNLVYNTVPAITANMEYLYYQDESNPGFVGQIKLINNVSTAIDIEADIIGRVGYTSPSGVVFTNGLKVQFDSLVVPASYANTEYYVDGVGTAISLIPVTQTLIAESFADEMATQADYITVNRGSLDRNSWSRSNRWFHKDVIAATAAYNTTSEDYGPNLPGRRPIIEFDPNLQLFNYGKQGKDTVDLITFQATDVFGVTIPATRVEGQISAVIDGITLAPGHRVVFANDYDLNVKNKIWVVTVIEGLSVDLVVQDYINLVPAEDNPVQAGENVLVTDGSVGTGHTYRFDGTNWFECQPKTALNQAPLFDIIDKDGYSFSDTTIYPSSTFAGNKIFSYYPGTTGNNDTVLGFPLRYQNFNNIGDIVFRNYYNDDTHTYITDTSTGALAIVACDTGYIVENIDLTTHNKINVWVKGLDPSSQYQLFTKFFDGRVIAISGVNRAFLQIDVLPAEYNNIIPHVKVFKNNTLLTNMVDYELTKYGEYNIIVFLTMPIVGDKLDVSVFSNETSSVAFYEVPKNLDQNPVNEKFSTIALGQIRTHYNKLIENTAVSNRPLHDSYIRDHGGTLSQHSAPLIYSMTFLNDPMINFVNGLDLAKKEYARFKNKFISLCSTLPNLDYTNPISGVDTILQSINAVKNSSFPWYYSDMVPQGGNYTTVTYTVLNARQINYEISKIFDNTQLSNRSILLWLNGEQLVLDKDYTFSATVPVVSITRELAVDDIIVIRDYFDTDGNFIPETPSKLGLYPKSEPAIYQDSTYQTAIDVIRGHDGSLTPAFGDFRDNYLLELEKRIYNNIKSDYSKNIINLYDIIPGRFRTTEYSREEFVQILSKNFLQWSGANNVDYTTNSWYDANNPWTWNYNEFTDVISDAPLNGSWRAIYNYWYDTDQPNLAPWQMLGFGFKPSWWETRYGPSPYTKGNFTLWEDLEAGYVWNNGNSYTDARFARPGLTKFIPVDSAGNLLPPTEIDIVNQYNLTSAGNSFAISEQGPVETAWRRSSDYPFAIQMTLAMCKPASYFGTQYDISRFYVNDVSTQFTDVNNQKIHPLLLKVNGQDVTTGVVNRTSGYVNWIADSLKNVGIDPVAKIQSYLSNLTVKLNYKIAGFTDKNTLTVTAEQTAPGTTRAGVIIPDSNYDVYLNKSVPVASLTYSAVIVQKTSTGYSVTGYDTTNPFFTILPSIANANAETVMVDDATVKLYQDSASQLMQVPYGTTYATSQQVSDFLISYERYLEKQGFRFNQFDADLQEVRNFKTSVKEFLFWTQQGWDVGTLIILNPAANLIAVKSTGMIVDEIMNVSTSGKILDRNFLPIKSTNFNILRTESPATGNMFRITTLNDIGICLAHLKLIQYEHVLVFDNETDFGDIIYIPSQGVRQYRLKLAGTKTGQWTGALSAAGYIYSNSQVAEWQTGVDYQVGDIVTFNNNYYTALSTLTASTKFDVSSWAQIQEQDIKTGLLPSFGQQAQQFDSIYNIDQPPNNESLQLFSAGLIGFRPRSYLTDLGISIPNQTKFYQGYIKEKGTINSITALTKAGFNNVSGAIEVFEEWGFKVGAYGDLDGNQFKEFILDQSIFNTNPVAFTSTTAHSTGNIIVNLNGNTTSHYGNLVSNSDVYNASNLTSTSTTIYSNRAKEFYTNDLPTAGFVHLDDIDLTIFDITTYDQAPTVSVGSKIWVAKDVGNQWNVYRATETNRKATQITYVLDTNAQIDFNGAHGLVVGDLFVLSGFNIEYFNNTTLTNYSADFDSTYEVIEVVDSTTVTVQIKNADVLDNLIATSPVVAEADVYKLVSMHLPTIATISSILPPNGWIVNDRVWVSTDVAVGATGWAVYTYNGSTWVRTRQQQNTVDLDSVNRTFIYNKTTNDIIAAVDIVDPVKGKVLTTISSDIDYRLDYDPATYNAGNVTIQADRHWGPDQVGRIWWNLDNLRYINYEQDALIYRLNHWGEQFPGSSVEVYEWVESTVLPSEFVASGKSGTPLHANDSAYSTYGYVDQAGTVKVKYYFWVSKRDQANTRASKQNSVIAITSAIENPQNQNIPYATVLRDDTIALYNVKNLLVGQNSILHLGSQSINAGLIHSEYALVQEKSAKSQLPVNVINKLIDSLAEIDRDGNPVPDPNLPVSQRYGVEIRPRQTMFVDIYAALVNLITLVNQKLYVYPVIQRKVLTLLNSEEAAPGKRTGVWLTAVDTKTELGYINTDSLPTNGSFKVLVNSDPAYLGKWSIYAWDGSEWTIPTDGTRLLANGTYGNWVQSYKTNLYWSYADWYATDFDPTTSINITVNDNLDFGKLILTPDTYIKVLNAGNDKFAIYYIDASLTRITVGLQDGTILLPDASTTVPGLELRQILLSLQHEIFIDDLAQDFNEIFFAMIKYALAEQKNLDWVFKTSFVSATQYIRKLEQFPSYISDNQDFYQSYINEVKPYRTILREFNINYQRNDEYGGDITDFDLAPYWDSNINVYRSPSGEQSYDALLLNNQVYRDWKNNYTYGVVDITVGTGGTGYVLPPQIIISGGGGTGANAVAQINEFGQLANITMVTPGSGYTSTPTVTINGTGSGAVATPVLRNIFDKNDRGHNVVRSIRTNMKFDRITYDQKRLSTWGNAMPDSWGLTNANAIVMWDEVTSGQIIAPYTIINVDSTLYQSTGFNHTVNSALDFPIANVTAISAANLTTANDRIVAYNGNIDLSATTDGIDYPGVIVDGSNYFAYDSLISFTPWTPETIITTGTTIHNDGNLYKVIGNVYGTTFDSISSQVSLISGTKIDTIIQSRYSDNLGIDAGNIYVDGGVFIDRFSSHAPEELVPGRMFDSLNLKVFSNTAPGTNDYAFRLFDNMSGDRNFYRISNASTTTLVRDLSITDDQIYVTDGLKLPLPGRVAALPGVVFINGEKIVYYRNYAHDPLTTWASNTAIAEDTLTSFGSNVYLITGNVFATNVRWQPNTVFAANSYIFYSGNSYQITGNARGATFNEVSANLTLLFNNENSGFASITNNLQFIGNTVNVLGQIRRAVDGTGPAVLSNGTMVHLAGSRVVDSSMKQQITASGTSNVRLASSTTKTVTANVSLKVQITGNITANVGDFITQKFANATVAANLRVIGNVVSSSNVAVIKIGGNITSLSGNLISIVKQNGGGTTNTAYGIKSNSVLGTVNTAGNVTVSANTYVATGNIWYGNTTAYYYSGNLKTSTTAQATFLTSSPGYVP